MREISAYAKMTFFLSCSPKQAFIVHFLIGILKKGLYFKEFNANLRTNISKSYSNKVSFPLLSISNNFL